MTLTKVLEMLYCQSNLRVREKLFIKCRFHKTLPTNLKYTSTCCV